MFVSQDDIKRSVQTEEREDVEQPPAASTLESNVSQQEAVHHCHRPSSRNVSRRCPPRYSISKISSDTPLRDCFALTRASITTVSTSLSVALRVNVTCCARVHA